MRASKRRHSIRLRNGACLLLALLFSLAGVARAYDQYAMNNLQRSRDALLQQQAELQRAYDDTARKVAQLQQALSRLDSYLDQNQKSIRDVEAAMNQLR